MPNEEDNKYNELTDVDETLLFMTKPYMLIVLACWFLSLYSIISLRDDRQSMAFIMSIITFIIDSLFLIILYLKAKRVWRRKPRDE